MSVSVLGHGYLSTVTAAFSVVEGHTVVRIDPQ